MSQQIKTLEELQAAALAKRSVVIPQGRFLPGPRPAAFVLNMAGCVLLRMFQSGMYIYTKTESK